MSSIAEIRSILKYDKKQTTYKHALLRALCDIVLMNPQVEPGPIGVAVPLRLMAERWIAYYWPFVTGAEGILQGGTGTTVTGKRRADIAFRRELTSLRAAWDADDEGGETRPEHGHVVVSLMARATSRQSLPAAIVGAYETALRKVTQAVEYPIRHAGPGGGDWSVFPRPAKLAEMPRGTRPVPSARPNDKCLLVRKGLWELFQDMGHWIEALCVHEWAVFTEHLSHQHHRIRAGEVFSLLLARPEERRVLSWERRGIDRLLADGVVFVCPWSKKRIVSPEDYDLDHVLPFSVYPTNELWNLVPADSGSNREKTNMVPSLARLKKAKKPMADTFAKYLEDSQLRGVLEADVLSRFASMDFTVTGFPEQLAEAVTLMIDRVGEARNLPRY